MAIGISYAAVDDEVTALSLQGAATGGVIIISCVFTMAFHYAVQWLNKIHEIEQSVEPAKQRRMLKPIGTAVETKEAYMRYRHYYPRAPPSDQTDNSRVNSNSQSGDNGLGLDMPYLVMAPEDNATDGGEGENAVYLIDHIGGEMMKPFSTKELQQMTLPLLVTLFLSSTLFLLGLMACKLRFYPIWCLCACFFVFQ